uniref:Uncharacterized protein n=1 Tax=viral metagenome TaxID=1070528 RepID=A0A6M3M1P8_9ZZZZ
MDELLRRLEKLEALYRDNIDSRLQEVERNKSYLNIEQRFESIFAQLEEMASKLGVVLSRLQVINLDKRFLELFTDDELREFYNQADIGLKELAVFIEKYISGKHCGIDQASKYKDGHVKDLQIRSKVGKFLREYALTRTKAD